MALSHPVEGSSSSDRSLDLPLKLSLRWVREPRATGWCDGPLLAPQYLANSNRHHVFLSSMICFDNAQYTCYTYFTCNERNDHADTRKHDKQNVTSSLSQQVLRKAKILAARRDTSMSGLLAQEIESPVGSE